MTIDLLTAGGITAAFSLILSLLFILIPPLRAKFVSLDADTQQAVTGIGILAIAVIAVALGCAGVVAFIPCTSASIFDYILRVVVAAIVGDRVSKAAFATARWWDARAEQCQVKTLSPIGDGGAGLRLDDGSDNNYVSTWLKDLGDGTARIMREIRTGGGAPATTNGALLPVVFPYRLAIYYAYSAGTWIPYTYIYGSSLVFTFSSPAAVSWTPARWGAVHNQGGEVGYSSTDWLAYLS